jgi:hypothetical protein
MITKEKFKIEAKPLTEQQIKVYSDYFAKNNSFPGSKIPCSITGKLTTCVGPWMKKKIKEFGSAENLLRNYTCRQAGKQKKSKPIGRVKKKKNGEPNPLTKEQGTYNIPQVNLNKTSRPLTEDELSKDSETICLRPDIFIANGRHCDGCKYYKLCRNELKNLPKHIAFDGKNFISKEEKKIKKNKL